jgi:SAM-dependent methyltransferase
VRGGGEVSDVSEAFGASYAEIYDAIYRVKDYEGEVDLIERILVRQGLAGPRRVLDLGCGTGNHALPLARRGHKVVAVDRSPGMLAQARAKASEAGADLCISFRQGDIRKLDLGTRFEAALMMFTVLGYQIEEADFTAALAAVRRHLEPGGLFIFDVWNGLAVLAEQPRERRISLADGATRITRETQPILDVARRICRVCFNLERVDDTGRAENWREEHVMRYYFPDELELALERNELDLLRLRSFPDDEAPADARAWNIIGVARAR